MHRSNVMKIERFLNRLVSLLIICTPTVGFAITIDFEGIADFTPVGNTYSPLGVSFNNATVLTRGISLNEAESPPHSGDNVAFDDGGAITGTFNTLVGSISIYATYTESIILSGYDAFGALVMSDTSSFTANTVSSGGIPNELMEINYAAGIKTFRIEGSASGGSFTLDDFSFSPAIAFSVPDVNSVPMPVLASLWGLLLLVAGRRFSKRSH